MAAGLLTAQQDAVIALSPMAPRRCTTRSRGIALNAMQLFAATTLLAGGLARCYEPNMRTDHHK